MTSERPKNLLFGVVVRPLQAFLRLEASSGILLLLCAVAALVWANLHGPGYRAVFACPLAVGAGDAVVRFTFAELINDGLMTIFFFVLGMEIKRELVVGELNSVPKASLPAIAAMGGMIGFVLLRLPTKHEANMKKTSSRLHRLENGGAIGNISMQANVQPSLER